MTDKPTEPSTNIVENILNFLRPFWEKLQQFFRPETFKELGVARSAGLFALIFLLLILLIAWFWNLKPGLFDVQALAQKSAERHGEQQAIGYVTTHTLIKVASTLLDKPGGYLSNDIMPPSVFMDDMPNWEFGVLQQVRDFTKALRNDLTRSRTGTQEDPDLAKAEPKFNADNRSWFWPASEHEYREGIEFLEHYLRRLSAPNNQSAQFLARADNLRDWLEDVIKRLGHLSQRLSASVGQMRVDMTTLNTDNTAQLQEIREKTSWFEIDDVFYQARGNCWALIHFLKAIEIDFKEVLEKRHAQLILQQVIRELEMTQKMIWSPIILNGSGFGIFTNHSLVLSSYISRANTGIIELHHLL
jgi:hypothetical protein